MALSKLYSRFVTDEELNAVSGYLQEQVDQGGGGGGSGIGPLVLNAITNEIEYNIYTNSTVIDSISPSGIWLKNAARALVTSAVSQRSPVLGFSYANKLGGGTGMPYTGYETTLSAAKSTPLEVHLRGDSGFYYKLWGLTPEARMTKSASSPSYFGYTSFTELGGTRFTSGSNSILFTSPQTGRIVASLTNTSPSGYYTANYKIDVYAQPSSFSRDFRFYLEGSGERMVANAYESQYYLTIPANTSGRFTVVANPSLIVQTGLSSLGLNVLVDYQSEATEQVRMSGYLRLTVQS